MVNKLESAQKIFEAVPLYSLADITINGLRGTKSNKTSDLEARVQNVVRGGLAYFIYPRVSPLALTYNTSIGVVHLIIGSLLRFRATDEELAKEQTWDAIALQVHKGCSHILTGGYDFAVGFLLRQKYIGVAAITAFIILPSFALLGHHTFFKKSDAAPPTQEELVSDILKTVKHLLKTDVIIDGLKDNLIKLDADKFNLVNIIPIVQSYTQNEPSGTIETLLSFLKPKENTEPKKPAKFGGNYLDPTCMISQLATEFTTIVMPPRDKSSTTSSDQTSNMPKRILEYLIKLL